jgi:hypothetical protein
MFSLSSLPHEKMTAFHLVKYFLLQAQKSFQKIEQPPPISEVAFIFGRFPPTFAKN